jgi:hypothetical protein
MKIERWMNGIQNFDTKDGVDAREQAPVNLELILVLLLSARTKLNS